MAEQKYMVIPIEITGAGTRRLMSGEIITEADLVPGYLEKALDEGFVKKVDSDVEPTSEMSPMSEAIEYLDTLSSKNEILLAIQGDDRKGVNEHAQELIEGLDGESS